MLRWAKLVAMNLCILLTSIISLGVMQKLALAVVGSEKLCVSAEGCMHSRSLCYSLRSDEKSRSWPHGLLGSVYASEGKVDGDEAGHPPYLYYFLRGEAKTGFGRAPACSLRACM